MQRNRAWFLAHFCPTQEEQEAKIAVKQALTNKCNQQLSVALLTIYDMCKAADRGMVIENLRLLEKTGGKSGHWQAGE